MIPSGFTDMTSYQRKRINTVILEQIASLTNFEKRRIGWRCKVCGLRVIVGSTWIKKFRMHNHYERHQLENKKTALTKQQLDELEDNQNLEERYGAS